MKSKGKKPELLAPAGDFERLEIAVEYGADAVYLSGTSFGLRAKAKNFTGEELEHAINYAHERGVRVYVTANIFAHNSDIHEMAEGEYFSRLAAMGADAFIVSDPGVFSLARREAPKVELHISTQANTTNYASVSFWHKMGAARVILARELSLEEISEIRLRCPEDMRLEAFVHGAMCMAYSGRCMLSQYMSGRDANRGACAHPCRYDYKLYAEELTRPGRFMPLEESKSGTDIFGAEDLCMVAHIPAMVDAGLESLKIEGRMKSSFYVGLAVRTYRQAIDAAFDDPEGYKESIPRYIEMLQMASHRPFSTGFYFGAATTGSGEYTRSHDYVGIVKEYNSGTGSILMEQRNVFEVGDKLTFIGRSPSADFTQEIKEICDENGAKIKRAAHAQQRLYIPVGKAVEPMTLACRKIK